MDRSMSVDKFLRSKGCNHSVWDFMKKHDKNPVFQIIGDRSLLVELGDEIAPGINQEVTEFYQVLLKQGLKGVVDLVPCYRSIMVCYDPLQIELSELKKRIMSLQHPRKPPTFQKPRIVRVPVVYGGAYGPDLDPVAHFHRITAEEVVNLHISRLYRVYMIGFTPGHPYLGELPEELAIPRKETPRPKVPRGSVGIAQRQIVIYPAESPGGFQIIGRTPLALFDPLKNPPAFFEVGDQVEFYPITEKEMSDCAL